MVKYWRLLFSYATINASTTVVDLWAFFPYKIIPSSRDFNSQKYIYIECYPLTFSGLGSRASNRTLHDRVLEVFTSPSALIFISLLLVILVIIFAALIIASWYRNRLQLFFFRSTKWGKAANKVVREANLLYPWAVAPPHNCAHQITKDGVNPSATSYIGLRSNSGARNLQVCENWIEGGEISNWFLILYSYF